jgi:hypothetical protein
MVVRAVVTITTIAIKQMATIGSTIVLAGLKLIIKWLALFKYLYNIADNKVQVGFGVLGSNT